MHLSLYHYTTGDRLPGIVAARAILPATAHVEPPEIPAVWLSSAPVWEASATKGVVEGGVRRQAELPELVRLCGCLLRIEIDPRAVAVLGPGEFPTALRIPPGVRARLIAAGLEMGADPAEWRAVAGPVPHSAYLGVEFSTSADPPLWVPWPGSRPRAC